MKFLYTRTLTRMLRDRRIQWIIAAIVVLNVVCFLTRDTCEIHRHPSYHGNTKTTTRDGIMSVLLNLAGYDELNTADVEEYVNSGIKLEDFNFVLNSMVCFDHNIAQAVYLLVAVPSKPSNFNERQAIRETWGSIFNKEAKLKLVFFIGLSDNITNERIAKEQEKNRDVIQASFVDSYKNLTLKTVAILQWKIHFCQIAKFLLKIDDDVFLQTDNLLAELALLQGERRFIMGHIDIGNVPYRNAASKWHTAVEEYPYHRFPTFGRGPSYLLSSDLVDDLHKSALHISRLSLEDVYVTGLCAHVARASHVGRCGFNGWRYAFVWFSSETVVTAYEYSPDEMREMWRKLKAWKDWLPLFKSVWKTLCRISFI